jgi:PBP1b-binding outer membrane lipoprotein LpoB
MGKMIAAKYTLEGDFTSIVSSNARVKDVFYKFTLKLIDTESGVIEWVDEKQIRKIQNK